MKCRSYDQENKVGGHTIKGINVGGVTLWIPGKPEDLKNLKINMYETDKEFSDKCFECAP